MINIKTCKQKLFHITDFNTDSSLKKTNENLHRSRKTHCVKENN